MARLLDQIVVVDVESTCWEGEPPEGQVSEIIEVGVCLLDVRTGERSKQQGMLVAPQRSTVSEFCTRLTTLTQEQVSRGISFEQACKKLRSDYKSKDRIWASYGDYDRKQFDRQAELVQIPSPFGPSHWNVKSLFAIVQNLHREVGMAEALEQLRLPLQGTHHRGVDDAWNIAGILWEILRKCRGDSA